MLKRIRIDDLEDSFLEEDSSLLNFFDKKDINSNLSGLKVPEKIFSHALMSIPTNVNGFMQEETKLNDSKLMKKEKKDKEF